MTQPSKSHSKPCYWCGSGIEGRAVNRKDWMDADSFDWRAFCSDDCADAWFQWVLVQGAVLDAHIIKYEHQGGQVRDLIVPDLLVPLYHAPRVPTYAGAVTLAQTAKLEIESVSTVQRVVPVWRDWQWVAVNQAEVLLKLKGQVIQSAAMSRDADFPEAVARGLALRNAVQRALFPSSRGAAKSPWGKDIES